MALVTIGVKGVKFGALAGDGGPGTALTSLGFTSKGTLSFNEDAPTKKLVEIEEDTDPLAVFKRPAPRTITLSLAAPDLDTLARLRGGTVTPGTSGADDKYEETGPVSAIGTLEIEPEKGFKKITYNHVSIDARFNGGLGADQELLLVLEVDILKSPKADTPTVVITAAPSS